MGIPMRTGLLLATLTLAALSNASLTSLFAQGNSCAPPSFRGPDGPRPSAPPAPGGGNDAPVPTGDTGRPTGPQDPVSTPTTDPQRGPSTPRGGIPLPLTRGKSAKKRHVIEWSWPKPVDLASEQRLDYETVLATIRGDDPRPLFVLREGSQYGPGYDKLLHKKLENENIALLTRWFHCVRFSEAIMEDAHPWRALFGGEYPPHCFVVTWDGHHNEVLSGIFSLGRLQKSMQAILGQEYEKDAGKALTEWKRVLDKLDTLDAKQGDMRERLESLIIERGEKSSQVKTLRRQLDKIERERESIEKQEDAALDLRLKRKTGTGKSDLLDRLRGRR